MNRNLTRFFLVEIGQVVTGLLGRAADPGAKDQKGRNAFELSLLIVHNRNNLSSVFFRALDEFE